MKTYLNLLQHILDNGGDKGDRTGTGTRSVFGHQMRFDLSKAILMFNIYRTIKSPFGMNGQRLNKPHVLVVLKVN